MQFIQWNVRGVRSKLSWLQNSPFSAASFLVLQESTLNDSVPFPPKDKKNCADRPGSSRDCLITAVDINIPALLVPLSLPPSEVEVLIYKLWVIPNSNSPLNIVNLYSPRGKFDAQWLDSVISHLSPPFLILGGFNVHHPALGSLFSFSDASKVLDWISANNMCLLSMSQFARFQTGHAPSLLDLSICSADIYNNISFEISHDTYDSDHCPILMSLKNLGVRTTKTRQYINWNRFSKNINDNLSNSGQNLSIEILWLQFQSNAAASSSSYSISAQNHSPWWDARCSFLKALKRKALRKAKSYPSIANWSHYKKIAARLRKYIKHCTRSYWERTCAEVAKSHQAFRIIKAMLNKDVSPCQSHLILSFGMVLSSPTAQANAIATNLIKNVPAERIPLDFSENYPQSPAVQSLNQPFSMKEFKNALSKTSNRSPGPDKITKK
ncbi:hypothetical protein AVEN_111634-1 [Araneus ventricosus]|uniref:Endonuclease/exonuclease/phosphatase domain-containing protein n=1 Tax=Araneus ventricosus TaxID=182803 RepID=A0A4Y2C433_ARAVE|nr:hypothetical protein AVEN_111634-1 [Araneus ventricosus]